MPVLICLLRGVNVGGRNMIRMEALRELCESLELRDVRTYVQSGNVLFRTDPRSSAAVARRIETAIEQQCGFRPAVILRTAADMRKVVERNPFAGRADISPNKLLVTFLADDPGPAAADAIRAIRTDQEEVHVLGREVYIYFPNGMGRSKLSPGAFDKAVKTPGTGRNWNTVLKLLELAGQMEAQRPASA